MLRIELPSGATPEPADVQLHHVITRDGAVTELPLSLVSGSTYEYDPGTLQGRYWPTVLYTSPETAGGRYDAPPVDLPVDDSLVVSPESIASRANIPLPLTADQRETITEAILDAQADVVAYLGREITPTQYVQEHAYPFMDGWELNEHGDDDVLRIESTVAETNENGQPTGYYTVTYWAGLDARNNPTLRPIARYVRAHTLNSHEVTGLWKTVTSAKGEVRSLSAEGQSVSFAPATLGGGGEPGSMRPGSLPTLASLDRWRVAGRRAYQAKTRSGAREPW